MWKKHIRINIKIKKTKLMTTGKNNYRSLKIANENIKVVDSFHLTGIAPWLQGK